MRRQCWTTGCPQSLPAWRQLSGRCVAAFFRQDSQTIFILLFIFTKFMSVMFLVKENYFHILFTFIKLLLLKFHAVAIDKTISYAMT